MERKTLWLAVVLMGLGAVVLGCGSGKIDQETGADKNKNHTDAAAGADADADSDADSDADASPDASGETDAGPLDASAPHETAYCGLPMLELPEDPAERGPWAVGARTVDIGTLHTEVWYPAEPGSSQGLDKYVYDLREYLPAEQQGAVDAGTIMQPCDCFRDLPIDDGHGPFPVIVFAHGMSGFKGQSLEFMTHWASRGFVVLSSDAPSIGLKTFLEIFSGTSVAAMQKLWKLVQEMGNPMNPTGPCDPTQGNSQTKDLVFLLGSLKDPSGGLAFLKGRIDLGRIGASGHSAGGGAVNPMGAYPNVKVVVPMAAGGTCGGASLESTLVMGGMADSIVKFSNTTSGYASSPPARRLVGLRKAGHMAFTSFCPIGAGQGGIIAAAEKAGVTFNPLFKAFIEPLASDGCGADSLDAETGWEIINYASSAAFEEILMCIPERREQLKAIQSLYPDVGVYNEVLQ